MSIKTKLKLLRISRERSLDPNLRRTPQSSQVIQSQEPIAIPQQKKIQTVVKSQYLGKNLYPDYIGKYKGKSFIVVGCGSSINFYTNFSNYFVIGVNDIERILIPDFLVVVNDFRTFDRGRWGYIQNANSPVIFSHLDPPGPINRSSHLVKIQIGERGKLNLDRLTSVDYTMNSPYMAVIIAYQLGARKIGIVGVDFTLNHFFAETGTHKLSKHIKTIDHEYGELYHNLEKKGVKCANLSPISLLESWPKMTLQEFDLI